MFRHVASVLGIDTGKVGQALRDASEIAVNKVGKAVVANFTLSESERTFTVSRGKVPTIIAGMTQYMSEHPDVKIKFEVVPGNFFTGDTMKFKFSGPAEAVLEANKHLDKLKDA